MSSIDEVYASLQEILRKTLGRQVKFFGNLYADDDTRVLKQFEVKKDDDKRSLHIELRFNDYSSRIFNTVVAATIDWGYLRERRMPLIWLYEDNSDSIQKILFDVNTGQNVTEHHIFQSIAMVNVSNTSHDSCITQHVKDDVEQIIDKIAKIAKEILSLTEQEHPIVNK